MPVKSNPAQRACIFTRAPELFSLALGIEPRIARIFTDKLNGGSAKSVPIRNTVGEFLVFWGRFSCSEFGKLLNVSVSGGEKGGDDAAAFLLIW